MRFALYVSLLAMAVPIIFTRPFFGLCVYYIVSLMQPKLLCWKPDFQDSMIVGVPLVVGAIAFGVQRYVVEPRRGPLRRETIGVERKLTRNALFEPSSLLGILILLLAYIALNRQLVEIPSDGSAAQFSRLCKMALVTILLTGLASDFRRFRILYLVIALAVAFWAIKGGLNVLLIGPHKVYGRNYDNNFFALTSCMVLPMVFYFSLSLERSRWRWVLMGFVGLMGLAIICSQSRAGFLALAVVVFCLAWTSKHRVKALTGVAVLGIAAVITLRAEIVSRVESIVHFETDRSARSRLWLWESAFRLTEQSPLMGVGFCNFERATARLNLGRKAGHNIWFNALAELGILGYPLWAGFLLGAMFLSWRLMHFGKRCPPDMRWCYYWARGLLLGLIAYGVHGFFHNEEYLDLTFAMIGLVIALKATVARELRHRRLEEAARSPLAPVELFPRAHRRLLAALRPLPPAFPTIADLSRGGRS